MVSLPVELVRSTPPNDAHAKFGGLRHRAAHVHDIAAEPIKLGDRQHVTGFEAVEEPSEPAPLRSGDVARNRLGDTVLM
jgi:hypothetical protein